MQGEHSAQASFFGMSYEDLLSFAYEKGFV